MVGTDADLIPVGRAADLDRAHAFDLRVVAQLALTVAAPTPQAAAADAAGVSTRKFQTRKD
jgi:hypothetical protein